jgi:hypothetical protein
MRKNLLFSAAILLALSSGAFADGVSGGGVPQGPNQAAGANAAPARGTDAVEVPLTSSSDSAMLPGESGEVKAAPVAGASAQTGPSPAFASAVWCIGFFGSKTFHLQSIGTVLYRVVPTTFFNVTMRVTYSGLRSFFVNQYLAPGAETILIRGPSVYWPVNVTIRGYNGQRGCFRLFAG